MLTVKMRFYDPGDPDDFNAGSLELVMLDSCSNLNLISKSEVARLKLREEYIPEMTVGGVVPNASTKIYAALDRRIVLGQQTIVLRFYVVEQLPTTAQVLIGWPEWTTLNLNIDSGQRRVTMGRENVSFEIVDERTETVDNEDEQEVVVEVKTKKEVNLEPGTQTYVPIVFDRRNFLRNHGTESMITPSKYFLDTHVKLIPGRVTEGTKMVMVANLSMQTVQIPKGTLIGYLSDGQFQTMQIDLENMDPYMPINEPEWTEDLFLETVEPLINKDLSEDQRKEVVKLLLNWMMIFSKNPKGPGVITKTVAHVPLMPDTVPIRLRPYRCSQAAMEELRKQIREMLANKIIRKSTSAWGFPVVLAIKPDGSWRFCVDYSKLSEHVKKDTYVLPRTDDYLDRLSKAKYITVVDMASGFWQIPVREEDKEVLAFRTMEGNYEFNVLPFGYCNSSAIFQRAIEETLDPLLFVCCLSYIDDVAIYSNTFEEHMVDLGSVFGLLNQYKWRIKVQKCQFVMNEFNYLGHCVGHGLIKPLASNLEKLKSMKKPKNADDIASFLGFMGYYKRFIKGYDYLTEELRKLTKKNTAWEWNESHQLAYDSLIECLIKDPILKLPNLDLPFIVKTDASMIAWGAALVQVYDGVEHPVSFASGVLNKHQRNWPTWKRECYGAVRGILQWQHYLLGSRFKLVTDHKSLLAILDPQKKFPPIIIGWIMTLTSFVFDIEHRPGKELVIEDGLSRPSDLEEVDHLLLMVVPADMISNQRTDPLCIGIIKAVEENSALDEEIEKKIQCNANHFVIEEGVLYYLETMPSIKKRRIKRFVLTEADLTGVLDNIHKLPCGGHLGLERLWMNVAKSYWMPGLYAKIKTYFEKCEVCAINRLMKVHNSEMKHVVATEPMEIIEMDHMEMGVESDGYLYILVVCDVFSKKVWFIPTSTVGAEETWQMLFIHVFAPNRFCRKFISDHGAGFDNELSVSICKASGIEHDYNLPNDKKKGATGYVENRNRLCWSILRKFVDPITQHNWSKYCWTAAYAYNKSSNPLLGNHSPDFLFHGLEPFTPLDLVAPRDHILNDDHFFEYRMRISEAWTEANEALRKSREEMNERRIEELNGRRLTEYKIGDYVLIKNKPDWVDATLKFKLASRNAGPFKVVGLNLERNHVWIELSSIEKLEVHIDHLKIYQGVIMTKPFRGNMKEIIIIERVPDEFIELTNEQVMGVCRPVEENQLYDVRSIVGKKIALYWPKFKRYFIGIVIGYTRNLTANLISYEGKRDGGVERDVDFFKAYLYSKGRKDAWRCVDMTKYEALVK